MCNSPNVQLQQGAMVLGIFSLLASGYMTFLEYTDNPEEKYKEQVSNIKTTYKTKLEEMTEKEKYLNGIATENHQLVSDLTDTKNLVTQLVGMIEGKNGSTATPLPNEHFEPESENLNYHMEPTGNQTPLVNIHPRSGPPDAMTTSSDNVPDIKQQMDEYQNNDLNQTPSAPPVPDFLRSIETKQSSAQSAY